MTTTGRVPPGHSPTTAVVDRALAGLMGRDAVYMVLWSVQLLGAALVTPFITRLMPLGQYGLLASANAVMQVLFVLGSAGLGTALQRYHARGRDDQARKLLTLVVAITVAVAALAEATRLWWSAALGLGDDDVLVHLAIAWAATSAVTGAGLALLRSRDQLGRFAVVSLLQSVVAEAASLVLVASLTGGGARNFVAGQVAAQAASMLVALAVARPAALRRHDVELARSALRFALPLVPTALCTYVLVSADRLLLQALVGEEAVGAYQVAYNVAGVPSLVLGLLTTSWLPRLFALASARAEVLAASRDLVFRLLPPTVLGMCIGGPVVLRLWAPASYDPDSLALVLAVVVVSVLPEAAAGAAGRTLLLSGRTGPIAVATLVAAIVNVVLNIVLDPHLGSLGAALATLVSVVVLWLVQAAVARRVMSVQRPPTVLVLVLAVSAVGGLLSTALPVGGPWLVVRLAVGTLAAVWLARVVLAARSASTDDGGAS